MNNLYRSSFHQRLLSFDEGAFDLLFDNRRYLFRKETHLSGRLIKVYAEELGGTNFISLNYYPQILNGLLKPCEMPDKKVIAFINNCHTLTL